MNLPWRKNMRLISRVTFTILMLFFHSTFASSISTPTETDLKIALQEELPKFVDVISIDLEAQENKGDSVNPIWKSRFTAVLKLNIDLYKKDSQNSHAVFLELTKRRGENLKMYAFADSRLKLGKWVTGFQYEGYSSDNIGEPRSNWSNVRTVLLGTQEVDEYNAWLKEHNEIQAKEKKELDDHIRRAPDVLIGSWDEACGSWRGVITYINSNTIKMESDGKTTMGTWSIQGDVITVNYENYRPAEWRITKMTDNAFTIAATTGTICEAWRSN